MILNLKGFRQLIEDMTATLQSSATALVDVSVGSVIRAIFEANASVALWLQWLIVQVLQATRASTSSGSDLDSWMLDFGLSRLPAVPSSGLVTFSRYALGLSALIPVGSMVKSADGKVSFAVVENSTISIWSQSAGGYVIPSSVASADLPVVCTTAGSAGNVLAGTINVIAASLPGVDQAVNANPFLDGIDAESDDAFRNRFRGYLTSRSRATLGAIEDAIAGVRQGLRYVISENTAENGQAVAGSFLAIVDDGSGYPSNDLLSNVATAIEAVRPIGTTFAVMPPQVLTVNVSMIVELVRGEQAAPEIAAIQQGVANYLNNLGVGETASMTRLAGQAYQASPLSRNVTAILLNGSSADAVPGPYAVIKAGQIMVSTNGG